jgi:glycosyltransferase involved in cell wall biosynthesis
MGEILFDARLVRPGMTGVGNFAFNLLSAMPAERRARIGVILNTDSPYAQRLRGFRIHFTRFQPNAHPATELFEQFGLPLLCLYHGYDALVSFDMHTPLFHPGIRVYPFVYDLSSIVVPGSHSFKYSSRIWVSLQMARLSATRILTISETVRNQIIRRLRIPSQKTVVILPSDSRLMETPSIQPRIIHKPFLLAVSLTNRRKNIRNLLAAFQSYRISGGTLSLALTGRADLIEQALSSSRLDASSRASVDNLGFVQEGELRWLYENASALVYPSLDEGFGIPLVDAARFGCPVLCSDIPIFHEVMGIHARYFDPLSAESIANAMHASGTRSAVPDLPYSWERSAKHLLDEIANQNQFESD